MAKSHEEKQNFAKQYIRSLKAIEDEMEVYKDQKLDLDELWENIEMFTKETREPEGQEVT